MSGRLQDKVALVTGAGLGIGRATCVRMAEEGAEVIACSRTPSHLVQTCDEVQRATGRRPTWLTMDVAEPSAVNTAVDQAASRYGRIDIAVANTGQGLPHAPNLADTTDEEWS